MLTKISILKTVFGFIAFGFMCGCASTKQFVPLPDLARVGEKTVFVEVFRPNCFQGCANGFSVRDNGALIGVLGPGGRLLWERAAGPMRMVIGPKLFNLGDFFPISIDLQKANKYTFSASFPFSYPFSRNGVKQVAVTALVVPQTEERKLASSTGMNDSEMLNALRSLRDRGDITEAEYLQKRNAILDVRSLAQAQRASSSQDQTKESVKSAVHAQLERNEEATNVDSVRPVKRARLSDAQLTPQTFGAEQLQNSQKQEGTPEITRMGGVSKTNGTFVDKPHFDISAHIEDDPSKGETILGNGDGVIQKGEAFDLVVVIANTSGSTATGVTYTVTLPSDDSLKAYSELQHVVVSIVPGTTATNRINLAMPLNVTITKAPMCIIEVQKTGSDESGYLAFVVPTVLP